MIQIKLSGPVDFELLGFHCILLIKCIFFEVHCCSYLVKILKSSSVVKVDSFTGMLWNIYTTVREEGLSQVGNKLSSVIINVIYFIMYMNVVCVDIVFCWFKCFNDVS